MTFALSANLSANFYKGKNWILQEENKQNKRKLFSSNNKIDNPYLSKSEKYVIDKI